MSAKKEQEGWDALQFSLRWFLRADLAACDRLFGPRVLFSLLCSSLLRLWKIDRFLWWRSDILRDKREGFIWMPWPDRCRWRPGGISSIRSDAGCCARIPAEDRSHQAGEPPTPHLRFPSTALLDFSNFRLIFVWTEWCKGSNRGTLGFKNFWEEKWKYVIATHSQVCFACILFSLSISLWCSLAIPLWTQNTSDESPVDQVWHKRV